MANNRDLKAKEWEEISLKMVGSNNSLLMEMNGVSNVAGNPNIYNPGGIGNYIYATVPYGYRLKRYVKSQYDPEPWKPSNIINYPIYPDYNAVGGLAKNLGYRAQTMFGWVVNYGVIPTLYTKTNIGLSQYSVVIDVVNQVRTFLDQVAPHYWDGNNVCKRSCQTNCQVGCQSSCQRCVTSQCHNQNCGVS